MAVGTDVNRVTIVAIANQTVFNFTNILALSGSDIDVFQNGVALDPSSYGVTFNGAVPSDGFVTLPVGIAAGTIIIIQRRIDRLQQTVYNPGTAFPAKSHELALDRLTLLVQDAIARQRRFPGFSEGFDANLDFAYQNLPNATDSKIPLFDPVAKQVSWVDPISGLSTVAFAAITGTLDISGGDVRIEGYRAPQTGSVNRNLEQRANDFYTVKDFGAVGDGVADDRAALVACDAASGNGWVIFPPGTYRVGSSLALNNIIIGRGTAISVDSGQTLTVAGEIISSRRDQIFGGAGSVEITLQRPVFAEWFGAVADGVVNCQPSLNAAANACQPGNGWIQLNTGTYRIDSVWTITNGGMRISGAGRELTAIAASFASGNEIVYDNELSITVENLLFNPSVTKTAGACIALTSTTGNNSNSVFQDIRFDDPFIAIDIQKGDTFRIKDCHIFTPISAGIVVRNIAFPGNGNSMIESCVIRSGNTTGTGIVYGSGNILQINNCNFSGMNAHIDCVADDTVNLDTLIIGNCVFAAANTVAVQINKEAATTGSMRAVIINGCRFAGNKVGVGVTNNVASFLRALAITGCAFNINDTQTGIDIDGSSEYVISNNIFYEGSGGIKVGIAIAAAASNGLVADNVYQGLTSDFSGSSTTVIQTPRYFYGSATVDFGNMVAGGVLVADVTVTGADVDMVAVANLSSFPADVGFVLTANVRTANQVRVTVFNATGGAVDPASGTMECIAFRPQP